MDQQIGMNVIYIIVGWINDYTSILVLNLYKYDTPTGARKVDSLV